MSHKSNERNRSIEIIVGFYNLKELANIYDVSRHKMRYRIERIREQVGKPEYGYDYSPKQVKLLFSLLPLPPNVVLITKGSA